LGSDGAAPVYGRERPMSPRGPPPPPPAFAQSSQLHDDKDGSREVVGSGTGVGDGQRKENRFHHYQGGK